MNRGIGLHGLNRLGAGLLVMTLGFGAARIANGAGDRRNLIPEARIAQDDINSGDVPFDRLFLVGMHIFSSNFTSEDGYGEAPDGPRRSLQSLAGRPNLPFLRFNGLDAQSCFGCHSVIGFEPADSLAAPLDGPKQPGIAGGGGSSAANAFGFDQFPNSTVGFVRNPPHTFGSGYTQRLAEEMSEDLMAIRDEAIADARGGGRAVARDLTTKGVSFGSITVLPNGRIDPAQTTLEGVSEDLVVRPFQFKGLASTLRSFVTGALNFHFSVQPKELLDRGLVPDDNPNGTLVDDERNEILEGEVTAIATFVAFLRPPEKNIEGLDAASVARGEQRFIDAQCASCHWPKLRIEDPRVTIIDPRILLPQMARRRERGGREPAPPPRPTLTAQEKDSEDLAPVAQYRRHGRSRGGGGLQRGDPSNPLDRLTGYTRDLNRSDGPPETLPRLPRNLVDGSVDVPLYSDLKRHNMGVGLGESFSQGVDVAGMEVPGEEYITRPLWGVADTGPWLHDGRALTLIEAIEMHESEGSEANDSAAAFGALTEAEKQDLRNFLLSLRLPRGLATPNNRSLTWKKY